MFDLSFNRHFGDTIVLKCCKHTKMNAKYKRTNALSEQN